MTWVLKQEEKGRYLTQSTGSIGVGIEIRKKLHRQGKRKKRIRQLKKEKKKTEWKS